jgi:hypothetical protein
MRRYQRSSAAFPVLSLTRVETGLPVAMIVGWRRNAAATSKSISDSLSIGDAKGRHSSGAMRSWARLSWRCGARCSGICPRTTSMPRRCVARGARRAAWPTPHRSAKNPHIKMRKFPFRPSNERCQSSGDPSELSPRRARVSPTCNELYAITSSAIRRRSASQSHPSDHAECGAMNWRLTNGPVNRLLRKALWQCQAIDRAHPVLLFGTERGAHATCHASAHRIGGVNRCQMQVDGEPLIHHVPRPGQASAFVPP